MARRSDHTREELRGLILQAARNIVEKSGSASLSMRKIAKEIGYAPGSIYNVFKSMDDLILALNAKTLDDLYGVIRFQPERYQNKDLIQNVKKMGHYYYEFTTKYRPHWLLLFNYELSNTEAMPDWYAKKISRLFDPLEKLLKSSYSSQGHHQYKLTVKSLWASVHGICFLEQTGKMTIIEVKASDMIDHVIDQFFLKNIQ